MRSDIGKRVRRQLFPEVPRVCDGFRPLEYARFKNEVWVWERVDGPLRQWVYYQQDPVFDKFTLGLSWSLTTDHPFRTPVGRAGDALHQDGHRFRIGEMLPVQADYWWSLSPPRPATLSASPEEIIRWAANPPRFSQPEESAGIEDALRQVIEALEQLVVPYFERVRQWASRPELPRTGV